MELRSDANCDLQRGSFASYDLRCELPGPRYVDRHLEGPPIAEPLRLTCNTDVVNGSNDGSALGVTDALKNLGRKLVTRKFGWSSEMDALLVKISPLAKIYDVISIGICGRSSTLFLWGWRRWWRWFGASPGFRGHALYHRSSYSSF